jgi:septal ring factor EnvC (AmiA/AmiB activator)
MNRIIQYLNLFGVLALAVLCAAQWQTNGQLNGDVNRLDKTRIDQAAKIADQDATLKQTTADLDDSRQRLSISESDLKDATAKLAAITAERDQLKANLQKWVAAVAARDDAIRKLSSDRDEAVKKYNDLVGKYNALATGK